MDLELNNKRILITGASVGIGAAIAKAFLKEKAKTIIVSRGSKKLYSTEKKLQSKYGENLVSAYKCDCTDRNSIIELKNIIDKEYKGLDVIIANVGDGRSVPDALPNEKQWQRTWDNNFKSALYTAREFLPMLKKSKGCLLFISSIAGMEAFGAPTDYSTAKAAVIALAKNIARKVAPDIRVNVISPGNVFFKGGSWDKKTQQDEKKVKKIINSTVPMKRFAAPKEIANAAVFLCSDKAKFITGANLIIDGGQTVNVF